MVLVWSFEVIQKLFAAYIEPPIMPYTKIIKFHQSEKGELTRIEMREAAEDHFKFLAARIYFDKDVRNFVRLFT